MTQLRKIILMGLIVVLLVNTGVPVVASPEHIPLRQETKVEPTIVSWSLMPGEAEKVTVTVTTASTPIPKIDVLFLFDVTSSMRGVLEAAKAHGVSIMNSLKMQVADAAFGVASFADYPGTYSYAGYSDEYGASTDYPWRLDVDITEDSSAVQSGIEALSLMAGGDGPESYSRALFETLYVGWRPGAKHLVVLFGDAPAHDTTFYGESFGVDPGVDAEAGTPDDLALKDVIAQAQLQGIEIIPINSDRSASELVQVGFQYMASQTGGEVYALERADDLPAIVAAGLTQATTNISSLALIPDDTYAGWVQMSPADHLNVGGGESRSFEVKVSVPVDAKSGHHSFCLTATGDGATLGCTKINITVGAVMLDAAEIKVRKYQLITDLSDPELRTEMLSGRWTLPTFLTSNYAEEEAEVKAWLDELDWNGLTPSKLAAAHRLLTQEQALSTLLHAQSEMAHIGNKQMSHLAGLILSCISLLEFLEKFEGKHIVGKLITKLRNYAYAKLVGFLTTAILFFTEQLPPDPFLESFRMQVNALGKTFQEALENALAKEKLSSDLLMRLLFEVLVVGMDSAANGIHVARTKALVPNGLDAAKTISATSVELAEVSTKAAQAEEVVSGVVDPIEAKRDSLVKVAEEAEAQQKTLSLISDFASTVAYAATLTGAGAVPAQIGHAISLTLKLLDALMSSILGCVSYSAWWSTADVASNATDLTFEPDRSLEVPAWTGIPDLLSRTDMPVCVAMRDVSAKPALSEYTTSLLTRLQRDADAYSTLLNQLADAVQAGDIDSAEQVTDQLLEADRGLSNTFLVARQPVFAGAESLFGQSGTGFEEAYVTLGRSAGAFDGHGAMLYVYLIGWFADPDEGSNRQLVLDQIEALKEATTNYETDLTQALPYVENVATQPSVLVSDYSFADLIVGQTATLQVKLSNPAPEVAEGVSVIVEPGSSAKVVSETQFHVGSLAGGDSVIVEIPVTPLKEQGSLSLSTIVSNGSGTWRVIGFEAVSRSRQPSGGGLVFVSLLLVLAATAMYVFSRARRKQLVAAGVGPTGSPVPPGASLVILGGFSGGKTISVSGTAFTIGRSTDSALRLNKSDISRRHAVIRYARGRWFIQDQNTTTGTFVNGRRVTATALSNGDVIRVGDVEMRFRAD